MLSHTCRSSGSMLCRRLLVTSSSRPAFPSSAFASRSLRSLTTKSETTAAPKLYTFVVYAPDYTDAEGLNRRLAARPSHLPRALAMIADGTIKVAGPLISPETYNTDEPKMIGSMGIFEGESIEAVRKIVESDPYWKTGTWDKEKLTIVPFTPAYPFEPRKQN